MVARTSKDRTVAREVLIFPARAPELDGEPLFFLFSVFQIEEIFREITVCPVPFSPPFAEGVAEWREQVLPVISLEAWLGLETLPMPRPQRLMVVRAPRSGNNSKGESIGIIRVTPALRKVKLPIPCALAQPHEWFSDRALFKGVYKWEEGLLLVIDLQNLLGGT
ncbi:MAG: chemotaxis protein CheW [Desulfobacterales bacterium]|nr:MAG: chemotaxis protein CheW [Desulfobacterales bacterium]